MLEARAPLYQEVATVEIDTVKRSANQVAAAVLTALDLDAAASPAPASSPGDPDDEITPSDDAPLPDPVFGRPGS